jgi:hypothetical protein
MRASLAPRLRCRPARSSAAFLKRSSWSTRNVTIRDGCRRMWYAVYCKQIRSHDVACNLRAHLRPAALDVLRSELTFLVQLDEGVEILAIDQNSTHISAVVSAGTRHPNRREVAGKHQIASAPVAQANVVSRLLQGEQARFDCSRLNGLHSVLIVGAPFGVHFRLFQRHPVRAFPGKPTEGGSSNADTMTQSSTGRRSRLTAHVLRSDHPQVRTDGAEPAVCVHSFDQPGLSAFRTGHQNLHAVIVEASGCRSDTTVRVTRGGTRSTPFLFESPRVHGPLGHTRAVACHRVPVVTRHRPASESPRSTGPARRARAAGFR